MANNEPPEKWPGVDNPGGEWWRKKKLPPATPVKQNQHPNRAERRQFDRMIAKLEKKERTKGKPK